MMNLFKLVLYLFRKFLDFIFYVFVVVVVQERSSVDSVVQIID